MAYHFPRPREPAGPEPPPQEVPVPRPPVLLLALLGITAIALYLCYLVARPFLPALAWALALAVIAAPLHEHLGRKLPPAAAAGASVVAVALAIIGPALFAAQQLGLRLGQAATTVRRQIETGQWRVGLESHPRLAPLLAWLPPFDLGGLIEQVSRFVADRTPAFVTGSAWAVVELLVTLFTLFFFLRDRDQVLEAVRALAPLSNREIDGLFQRVRDTIVSTVWVAVAMGLLQGMLGGMMFWFLGLPNPLLWGFVMGVLSVVPTLGSFVVWAPTALYLAVTGSLGKALVLTGWGLTVVATIDNLLYPRLVGRRLHLHTLTAFFGVVGGVVAFGASGLVIGPVALALTQGLLGIWRRRTRRRPPAT